MEEYIKESLATGAVRLHLLPAQGFASMQDEGDLTTLRLKIVTPPYLSSAFEPLQRATMYQVMPFDSPMPQLSSRLWSMMCFGTC